MKKLRAAAVIVFIASLVLLGLSAFRGRADKIPGPEIQMDADLIEVSVNDGEDVLKSLLKQGEVVLAGLLRNGI